jgi:hypothetical protein
MDRLFAERFDCSQEEELEAAMKRLIPSVRGKSITEDHFEVIPEI